MRVGSIGCALSLALAVFVGSSQAAPPQWIWSSKQAQDGESAYFVHAFQLDGKPKAAKLIATADDHLEAFVNGKPVLQVDGWNAARAADIRSVLSDGVNLLALKGRNDSGPAAVIARVELTLANGKKLEINSDAGWKVTTKKPTDWPESAAADWKAATALGKLGAQPWGAIPFGNVKAGASFASTDPDSLIVPEGFVVDLLYSVPKSTQGSWVSMCVDGEGRLICSDQYGSLFRVKPGESHEDTEVEKLDVEIGQAQGLLWAFDSLYVIVNGRAAQGSGMYRVRDTDGDDQFDEVKLLKRLNGGGEHGPHAIRLGPDGKLYVIAGNHTQIPDGIAEDSPHRNWAEDLLLPRNPDGNGHATGRMAPAGWIARTDENGKEWELFCAGFRNPYDIAFNADGELFTYDADMEWDTGAPWYRPTRVNHCTSAAEFGWRFGTGKWPEYYIDSRGAVVDIGLGSPTGIEFGYGTKFPAKWQQALYINDWTYGKIYAVHIQPRGASYTATFETFVQGRPLPVTDVVAGADGHLYFTIGGRRTQSGLYRVRYVGEESTAPAEPKANPQAEMARKIRRGLEKYHVEQSPEAVDRVWPFLNNRDRALRYAARVALERQDVEQWRAKALAETKTAGAIEALCALCRVGEKSDQGPIVDRILSMPLERMTEEQVLDALRTLQLAFIRLGEPDEATQRKVAQRLMPLFPGQSLLMNRELCRLLVYLEADGVIEKTLTQMKSAQTQQDQMFYVFVLRNVSRGWTAEQRRTYFSWLNLAEQKYRGGNSFRRFIQQIRKDASEKLTAAEKTALQELLEQRVFDEAESLETTRQFVHNWQASDILPLLDEVERGRDFEKGQLAFKAAQCYKCHRFAGEGGATGPDLTGVGGRFKLDYLVEAIVEPSKVVSDQYANEIIVTAGGEVLSGRVVGEDDKTLKLLTDPFAREPIEVAKAEVDEREFSRLSTMPTGLANTLTKEELLDLLAFMRSGGNPDDPAFKQ